MVFLTQHIGDYPGICQGKTRIPGVNDGEEFELTDVSCGAGPSCNNITQFQLRTIVKRSLLYQYSFWKKKNINHHWWCFLIMIQPRSDRSLALCSDGYEIYVHMVNFQMLFRNYILSYNALFIFFHYLSLPFFYQTQVVLFIIQIFRLHQKHKN